ncbi:MAG: phytase [Chloroflexales bacterium]|nr:phytase [Chloroflexales bacterium]
MPLRPRPLLFLALLTLLLSMLSVTHAQPLVTTTSAMSQSSIVRFAQFNASLNRSSAGQLITDLSLPDNQQARNVAEVIQRVNPDMLLINEFDYDASGEAVRLFQENYLAVSQNGADPIEFPYVFVAPSNTGIPANADLDNNGAIGGPGDAFGFGFFPGQFGMVLFSKYPIDSAQVRTFQFFLWKDMPGALLPANPDGTPWYSAKELEIVRLSSKSHWDVPIIIGDEVVHALVSHPTPPVFDGPEDRNGTRNHDEIRFWADYVTPGLGDYIYDDAGRRGGLAAGARFVIMGDQNADPNDGDSANNAILQLLDNPLINTSVTPSSLGGPQQAELQGGANLTHQSDPAFDTADFADSTPGNLRTDYVLPAQGLRIIDAGVFWPLDSDPLFRLVGVFDPGLLGGFPTSDHRLVWVDLDVAPTVSYAAETRSIIALDEPSAGERQGDADDPAIWINPHDPAQSLVIGVLKDGGLDVYDLEGRVVQSISPDLGARLRYNNVDVQYNFNLDGELVDLVVVTDRRNDLMVFFKVNPATLQLENITAPNLARVFTAASEEELAEQKTAYGIALYRSPDNTLYAFVSQRESNRVDQLELFDDGAGQVAWSRVRILAFPLVDDDPAESQVEGMVVDQELGFLYAGQENRGIWKFDAAPTGSASGTLIDEVYPGATNLKADVEGLTIYYGRDGAGYLLASSQGDSTFAVYARTGDNAYLGSFRVGNVNSDGVEFSDGADVVNVPLGPDFPIGLLIVHDGWNEPSRLVEDDGELENANTNFKFVAWENVANAFPQPLIVDTSSYNPRRERLKPVQDDFNRVEGGLRSLVPYAPWYGPEGLRGYSVIDQRVEVGSGGPVYWAERFGPDQAAFITLTKVDINAQRQGLLLKVQRSNWRSGSIQVSYADGTVEVATFTRLRGAEVIGTFPAQIRDGDQLGAQALADSTVRILVNGIELGRVDAGGVFAGTGGRIGLWFEGANDAVFDDFGGGDR